MAFDVNLDKIEDSEIRRAVADEMADIDTDGIIRRPGKFEGEMLWTIYFYAFVMNGSGTPVYSDCGHPDEAECGCETELAYDEFVIDSADAEVFPGLAPFVGKFIHVGTESSGFTWSQIQ